MRIRTDPPLPDWPTPHARRPIWTGHQVSLFHPGILAKYLAATAVSARAGVPAAQVAVDQDVYDPLTLAVPVRERDHLEVAWGSLGTVMADVPVGMQPPVRAAAVAKGLNAWPAGAVAVPDRQRLVAAFSEAERESETLAQQMDGVLSRLLNELFPGAYTPSVMASGLLAREGELLDVFMHDAAASARAYNDAVNAFPAAGVTRLGIEPDRIEVPMWALRWKAPRRRVYVDVADSQPMLVTEDGDPVIPGSNGTTLAPRALLMTALLRRPTRCSLFIHGTGGGVYDRITERWWQAWQHEKLAPMAVVTADLHLDFAAPVNDAATLCRAVWKAHHLPHNLDRELGLENTPAREKRELVKHMDDDRDKKRRRAAFALIHQINAELAAAHPEALAAARHDLDAARHGVANAAIARRRDWSFLLYPTEKLETLRAALAYPPVTTST